MAASPRVGIDRAQSRLRPHSLMFGRSTRWSSCCPSLRRDAGAQSHTGCQTGRRGIRGISREGDERARAPRQPDRSEEHTSELQSLAYLVCRLLLEKKKKKQIRQNIASIWSAHKHYSNCTRRDRG